jgi:hypothetical protein
LSKLMYTGVRCNLSSLGFPACMSRISSMTPETWRLTCRPPAGFSLPICVHVITFIHSRYDKQGSVFLLSIGYTCTLHIKAHSMLFHSEIEIFYQLGPAALKCPSAQLWELIRGCVGGCCCGYWGQVE